MPDPGRDPAEGQPRRVMYVDVRPFATYTADELLEVYQFLADLHDTDLYVTETP